MNIVNEAAKNNDVGKMMMKWFLNRDEVFSTQLESQNTKEVIDLAIDKKYITRSQTGQGIFASTVYRITPEGRDFVDEGR